MMKIERLAGTASRLYELVAPLVMNPDVLKQNNGYPFKTSEAYVWFIGVDDDLTRGFMPVEIRTDNVVINNYYVEKDDGQLLQQLIRAVDKEFGKEYVFDPLDMESVECETDAQGISDGGNGFAMNVYDMAKIGQLYLNK